MIAYGPSPAASDTTGTATRNAASMAVRGPKTRRMRRAYGSESVRSGPSASGASPRRRAGRDGGGDDEDGCGRPRLRRLRRRGRGGERRCRRLRTRLLGRALGGLDDRGRNRADRLLAEAGGGEKLLGAVLRAGEDGAALCTRPLERLLDLCACCVRELGRLVARLLEEPVALGLRLLQLAGRFGVRLREQLARLVPCGVQQLAALPLALLAVALELALALLQVGLAAAHFFLGLPELCSRSVLCVALDRVGELRRGADEMECVHADGVPGRLDGRGAAGGLEDAQLSLQLGGVAPEARRRPRARAPCRVRPRARGCPRSSGARSTTGRLRDPGLRLSCAVPPFTYA